MLVRTKTYVIGTIVSIGITLLVDDVLTNAASVTCTVKKPDGTSASPSVIHDGTGVYHVDIDTTAGPAGAWKFHVVSTGSASGAGQGEFIVQANNTA